MRYPFKVPLLMADLRTDMFFVLILLTINIDNSILQISQGILMSKGGNFMYNLFKSSQRKFLISCILMIAAIVFLLPLMNNIMESTIGTNLSPDSDFFYDSFRLEEIRQIYGITGGLTYFKTRITLDVLWPLIYLFFMISSISFLGDKINAPKLRSSLLLLSIISVVLDFTENIFCSIYFNLSQFRIIATAASTASALKWIAISTVMIAILLMLFNYLFKLFIIKNKK